MCLTSANFPNYLRIDYNYFDPRPLLVDANGIWVNSARSAS